MLQEILLDDERFSEIAERAKARIAEIYPVWTDYNYHDPGITILELFAWLKELQQFHMDQIGEAHIRSYLKLLGASPREKQPAKAVIRINAPDGSLFFPQKSRCFADDICFETEEETRVEAVEAAELVSCPAGRQDGRERVRTAAERGMRFLPFGAHPAAGDAVLIGLCAPLKPGVTYRIGIELAEEKLGTRNPIRDETRFYPLARFALFFQSGPGWESAEIEEDTTHQFLEDGFLAVRIEAGKGEMTAGERGRYWLKLVLEEAGYEVPPAFADICFRKLKVRQQRTAAEYHDGCLGPGEAIRLSTYLAFTGKYLLFRREGGNFYPCREQIDRRVRGEEVFFLLPERPREKEFFYRLVCYEAEREEALLIGNGTGLPRQEYELRISDVCAEGLAILVETGEESGCYVCPKRCGDFSESGPLDLVFCYEEETGRISFGDGVHGAPPEGKILLAAACQSLGRRGNVKEGSICRIDSVFGGNGKQSVMPDIRMERPAVTNERPAAGGRDAETPEECRKRLLAERRKVRRAVTYEDFEALALAAPGLMVESVRAIPAAKCAGHDGSIAEECVTLVVKPYSPDVRPVPGEAYCRNILGAIEPGRLIGARVVIVPPEYIGISVFAEIAAGTKGQEAKRQVRKALAEYFAGIRGKFGTAVCGSEIYAVLDVLAEVTAIRSLTLDARGRNIRRSRSGDLILPASGLAYLKECIVNVSPD